MKQIWIPRAGEPEVLELREAAAGVNFADIVARMGLYPGLPPMPVVAASFSFERAAQAHHYIQDRKNLGKVLLAP